MSTSNTDTEYQPLDSKNKYNGLPRIDYNLSKHKLAILINWTIIFLSSGVAPVVLYFALRYGAKLELSTTLGVASAVFGVFSVFSLSKRTFLLLRSKSQCRPLGATKWMMDYFNINFMCAFVALTAVIVAGNVSTNIRVFALGLPILITEVCFQMFLVGVARWQGVLTPVRLSSVPVGEPVRSGVYILAEDIIAVDAGAGQIFRRQLQDRYLASKTLQNLCFEMDLFWGITGTLAGIGTAVALFVVSDENVAFILAFAIPWGYAAIMAILTLIYCKVRLQREEIDKQWARKQGSVEY